jgi:hypothetical protein
MLRSLIGALALAATLSLAVPGAQAFDESKYPNWKGQWVRIGAGGLYDPDKPPGRGQQPPITEEYRAIWEKNIAEARAGGQYYNPQVRCIPSGMPRMMIGYEPIELIVLPEVTYMHMMFNSEFRRIYTDGRSFPEGEEPSYAGYSIGKWLDEDGDGKFDVLEVETRNFKGPRIIDPSGIPLHKDNQTVIKERIYLDKADPNIWRDQITVIDHAFTRPWTVTRSFRREAKTVWTEHSCAENNDWVFIEGESYMVNIDGKLLPTRKDQPPPDLRYFQGAK